MTRPNSSRNPKLIIDPQLSESLSENPSNYFRDLPLSLRIEIKKMRYELINEFDVIGATADDVWAIYSSPDLPKLILDLLPGVFESIDVVEGDGRVGTVLHLVYPPGSIPLSYEEKFVTMDNHKRLKEVRQIEGGYLEMGCTFYMDSFQILSKGRDSCIIKSISKYEISDELAAEVSPYISVDSLVAMARAISKYVLDQKQAATTPDDCDGNRKKHGDGHDQGHRRRHWLSFFGHE